MRIFQPVAGLLFVCAAPVALTAQTTAGPPWDSVSVLLGSTVVVNAGTYRYNFPRTDLTVRIGDVNVAASLALGSWAAFGVLGRDTVVMGDAVVTANELATVLRQFSEEGIQVTAIHNHIAGETPTISYVHFMGTGSAHDLARKVRRTLARTAVPLPTRVAPARPLAIDTALVFRELGVRGRAMGAVAQVSFDLIPGAVTLHGAPLPRPLGVLSPINLQAVSPQRYVATGDFTVFGEKVDPVLDALARHGITATAVHSHMVGESPALYYMHFWADGPPATVLRGLKAALDAAR